MAREKPEPSRDRDTATKNQPQSREAIKVLKTPAQQLRERAVKEREELARKENREKKLVKVGQLIETLSQREKIYKDLHLTKEEQNTVEDSLCTTTEGELYFLFEVENDESRQRISKALDRVHEEVMKEGKWPIPALDEKMIDEKIQKVEFVVHPLYSLLYLPPKVYGKYNAEVDGLWNEDDWSRSKNFKTYLEARLRSLASEAVESLKKDDKKSSAAYLALMETMQEWNAMTTPPPEDTLRVYVMPRRSHLSPERREAMHSMLETLKQQRNIAVVDSEYDMVGNLPQHVPTILKEKLQRNGNVKVQGGYLDKCLDSCLLSLIDGIKERKDIKYSVEFDPSTSHPSEYKEIEGERDRKLPPILRLPPEKEKNIATLKLSDIAEWIRKNETFNNAYRERYRPQYEERMQQWLKDKEKNSGQQSPPIKVSLRPLVDTISGIG